MNIPDKAVEAAVQAAFFEDCGDSSLLAKLLNDEERAVWEEGCRVILEAAAPFIAAQALRDAARVDFLEGYSENARLYREDVAADLRNRADELDPS